MIDKNELLEEFKQLDKLLFDIKEITEIINSFPTAGTTYNYIEDYNNFDD